MRGASTVALAGLVALAIAGVAARDSDADRAAVEFSPEEIEQIVALTDLPGAPIDPTNRWSGDADAAHLGRFLFFEERLSGNGEVSCATCHQPSLGFSDGLQLTQGVGRGTRHAQSLWNVAQNRWFLWDGRRGTLWSQAIEAIERPGEMNGHRLLVARLLAQDEELRAAYEHVFGEKVPAVPPKADGSSGPAEEWADLDEARRHAVTRAMVNVAKSIAAFEREIRADDSPFDRFAAALLDEAEDAGHQLSPAAQRGLRLFIGDAGCSACHSGPNLTDGAFHDTLLARSGRDADPGRARGITELQGAGFRADSAWSDATDGPGARRLRFLVETPDAWGAFKTPTLRNVALSPPYMHDGQFATLADVVAHYSNLDARADLHHARDPLLRRLGLSQVEQAALVSFLESLTDNGFDPDEFGPPASPIPHATER